MIGGLGRLAGYCLQRWRCLAARLSRQGPAGLVFIDGHEDATPMEASATREAANMEAALLLGLTGQQAPEPPLSRYHP